MQPAIPSDLRDLLEFLADRYNRPEFIETDPVSIPHLFKRKEDIEIAAFLTAILSWGNRKSIIITARRLMQLMDDVPFEWIMNHSEMETKRFRGFYYRTFNDSDCLFFLDALRYLYREQGGLEGAFGSIPEKGIREGILDFRRIFLSRSHLKRTEKHLSDPAQGSSSKRFHLFLRWMVRKDDRGVDFGLWRRISPSVLLCPLDVHAGKAARMLGLLQRKNNDWKAAEELTASLRMFDPIDPVKYDFALFGLGAMGDPTDRNE